jgi:ribosomal-protein-alanine N-acetyltransferase
MSAPRWLIRPAGKSDAAQIGALEGLAFGAASWGSGNVIDGLAAPGVETLIAAAEPGARASGFAMWRLLGEEAEILTIGVDPAKRRRGCAGALLSSVIEAARLGGARRLFLEVDTSNAPAEALYRRFGFAEVGRRRRYYKSGGDALVMRLDL